MMKSKVPAFFGDKPLNDSQVLILSVSAEESKPFYSGSHGAVHLTCTLDWRKPHDVFSFDSSSTVYGPFERVEFKSVVLGEFPSSVNLDIQIKPFAPFRAADTLSAFVKFSRALEKLEEVRGSARSFGEQIARIAEALGAQIVDTTNVAHLQTGETPQWCDYGRSFQSPGEARNTIDNLLSHWARKKVTEREGVSA